MRRGAVAPLCPVPPATPPSRSRAPPSFSSPPANASRAHLRAGGFWSPPRGGLPGPTKARAGAPGGQEVVDSERGGRVEWSLKFRQLRRRSRGADAERASCPFVQVAGQHFSGCCQSNPSSLASPPEALPSRVASEPLPRCPLSPVSAVPSSPVAVTRRPGSGRAHQRSSGCGAVRAPSPTRPSAAHAEPPASVRYNLRRRWGRARGGVCARVRAPGREAQGRGLARVGKGGD